MWLFFYTNNPEVEEIVDVIKSTSWRWFLAKKKGGLARITNDFRTLLFVLILI
jgi:hypothetical protein